MSAQHLFELVKAPGAVPLFLTGAGISVASGIAPFRGSDPDAVWSKDVMAMGTNAFFLRHPHKSWAWYLDRFDSTRHAEPNPAHAALVEIEQLVPRTRIITQNVDGLHTKAGALNLVEVHGSARKIRCTSGNCQFGGRKGFYEWDDALLGSFRAEPTRKNVPRCPKCRKYLRPHVLWFDESYTGHEDYGIGRALDYAETATVLVFVGTSHAVGITAMVMAAAGGNDIPIFNIDPHQGVGLGGGGVVALWEPAEVILPRLAASL